MKKIMKKRLKTNAISSQIISKLKEKTALEFLTIIESFQSINLEISNIYFKSDSHEAKKLRFFVFFCNGLLKRF